MVLKSLILSFVLAMYLRKEDREDNLSDICIHCYRSTAQECRDAMAQMLDACKPDGTSDIGCASDCLNPPSGTNIYDIDVTHFNFCPLDCLDSLEHAGVASSATCTISAAYTWYSSPGGVAPSALAAAFDESIPAASPESTMTSSLEVQIPVDPDAPLPPVSFEMKNLGDIFALWRPIMR